MQKINRRYKIKFIRGKKVFGEKQEPDFEFVVEYPITCKFEVARSIYSAINSANVNLLNLNENTKALLYKDRMNENIYITMEFYAGYGDFLPLIFYGDIKQCYSYREGGNTDFITDIEAWDAGFQIQTGYTSVSFKKGVTADEVLKSITATDMPSVKTGVIAPLPDLKTQRGLSLMGNTWDIITRLSSYNAFIDNNVLNVLEENQVIEGDFLILNADTGLLGSPKRSDLILNIETIFEPQVKVGQKIRLQSSTLLYANQDYKVNGFKHSGIIGEGECGTLKTTWDLFLGTQVLETITNEIIAGRKITSDFIYPVNQPITSSFGSRIHPVYGDIRPHTGIDFAAPMNTPVKASNSGLVMTANWVSGYGNTIILDNGMQNGNKISTLYAHLNVLNVKIGDRVSKGQIIGLSGQSGLVTAPNLHFEVQENGKPVNPLNYIKG